MLNQKSTECPQKNPHRQTIIAVATCSFTNYSFLLEKEQGQTKEERVKTRES